MTDHAERLAQALRHLRSRADSGVKAHGPQWCSGVRFAASQMEAALIMGDESSKAEPQGVTDAEVEIVGSALYIYWNDVSKQAEKNYRAKVRAALEAARKEDRT